MKLTPATTISTGYNPFDLTVRNEVIRFHGNGEPVIHWNGTVLRHSTACDKSFVLSFCYKYQLKSDVIGMEQVTPQYFSRFILFHSS